MSTTARTLRMKLLIDTKANRVLFAEADKDVVDFLFSLLALPVATIVKMLGKGSMPGSFGNLYGSVENLDYTYVLPGMEKGDLLYPTVVPSAASTSSSSLLLPALSSGQPTSFGCSCRSYGSRYNYVGYSTSGTICPSCGGVMSVPLTFGPAQANNSCFNVLASSMGAARGFVQGVVTYTVKDDLTVTPMSTISSVMLLNNAAVNFGYLQEKTVCVGYTEGLEIVKASLQSNTVLTDVFLGKKQTHSQY